MCRNSAAWLCNLLRRGIPGDRPAQPGADSQRTIQPHIWVFESRTVDPGTKRIEYTSSGTEEGLFFEVTSAALRRR